ncbi:tRNA synthetases class II-domain-containing protein [Trametes meyenii]|nr:tRNA synthetases class II-domain-containing protein [Trametes meyenii]
MMSRTEACRPWLQRQDSSVSSYARSRICRHSASSIHADSPSLGLCSLLPGQLLRATTCNDSQLSPSATLVYLKLQSYLVVLNLLNPIRMFRRTCVLRTGRAFGLRGDFVGSVIVTRKCSCQSASLHSTALTANVSEPTQSRAVPFTSVAHIAPFPKRTHTCGSLSTVDADKHVVLQGWLVPKGTVSKKLSFFGLRDSYGTTQLVVDSRTCGADVHAAMREIPEESTVLVEGLVRHRPESQQRDVSAGHVEVIVKSFNLLNPADRNMPFMPFDTQNLANEDLRLRYRYLDLRRAELTSNLKKRSDVAFLVRSTLHDQGFTEVETPMLLNSTPEGAREYLVPARAKQSPSDTPSQPLFYALSQSPQQPKQLLIVSGAVDRYFQLARCFRDEDGRKDRQPEFTQVDLEMAWVSWGKPERQTSADTWRIGGHEVRDVVETVIRKIWKKVEGIELEERFCVMTYNEAMAKYGSDKPDLRFGLEIQDLTSNLPQPLREALEVKGEILEALIVPGEPGDSPFARVAPTIEPDKSVERLEIKQGAGFDWLNQSWIMKDVLSTTSNSFDASELNETLGLTEGGTVWLSKRPCRPEGGWTPLGRLRLALSEAAQRNGDIVLSDAPKFLWVTEFPLFTRADEDKEFLAHGRWSSSHHPFTAPMYEDIADMYAGRVEEVRGQHYDLVLNGVEIGGGSVRVHDVAMQEYIFSNVLQLTAKEKESFNHLLHALRCGAPPHGGFAFGFDRLMAILCKTTSIRDVIAFPKTAGGSDLLFKSPSPSTAETLVQYALKPL